ncbi:hypothetical protein SETIT_5G098000v2 [Setaria italica]|uniref:Uncharacterized protein n=1 Tax=Setaria italica TaxID=4555 RepID=A0A368R375_SETIT|nr:hypothetical protein SETIT_5G098000v2 [Setaria italica]
MATGKSLAPACVAAMPCNLPRRAMPSSLPKACISPSNASIVRLGREPRGASFFDSSPQMAPETMMALWQGLDGPLAGLRLLLMEKPLLKPCQRKPKYHHMPMK